MLRKTLGLIIFFITITMAPPIYGGNVDLDINLNLKLPPMPPPPLLLLAPPLVAPIPHEGPEPSVYVALDVSDDIVFRSGFWFRRTGGHWYLAHQYNAEWVYMPPDNMPPGILALPLDLKKSIKGQPRIKHKELKHNWKQWDNEKRWKKKTKTKKSDVKTGKGKSGKSNKERTPDKAREKARGKGRGN